MTLNQCHQLVLLVKLYPQSRRGKYYWELEFEYSNGHKPIRFDGDNSYPYNFDKFQMLFGIDVTTYDEDE